MNEVSQPIDYISNPDVRSVCEGVIALCSALDQSVTALFDMDPSELDLERAHRFEDV